MSVRRRTHIFSSVLCLSWAIMNSRENQLSYLYWYDLSSLFSISPPHPIHVLQIIFVSLSTKGKFYEIEHSNVPQLFNAKTGKGGQSGQSKKQLNSDCVHRITSIIHDDAALPISLRYISKHSSGFMHNSYIPGKRRKKEKASSDETASERVSESVIVVWSENYDLFTLSEILAYLADALNLI